MTDNMVYCDLDYYKRIGYKVDFCDGNYENDLNFTIADKGIEGNNINSGCVYRNIDNIRQNPIL